MAVYSDVRSVRRALNVAQTMINLTADQLNDLRTRCSVTAELTQQEVRMLEGKLIKLYCKQLVAKTRLSNPLPPDIIKYPLLQQWLRVVGLTQESIQMVCSKVNTLEDLKEKSEHELNSMLNENCVYYKEDCRRLCKALDNLWRYMDILTKGDTENSSDLYWDSWDSYHLRKEICPKSILFRTRCSIPSESRILFHNNNDALPTASASLTLSSLPCISSLLKQECEIKFPSSSPPCEKQLISMQNSPSQSEVFPFSSSSKQECEIKFPSTPPPCKKQLINVQNSLSQSEVFLFSSLLKQECASSASSVSSASFASTASSASLTLSPPCISSLLKQECEIKFPSTPPLCKKQLINVQNNPSQSEIPLAKSQSESQLTSCCPDNMQLDNDDNSSFSSRDDFSVENKNDSSMRRNLPEQSLDYGTIDSGREENLLPNSSFIKSPIKSLVKSPIKSSVKSSIRSPIKSRFKLRFKLPPPICITNTKNNDNLARSETNLDEPESPVPRGMRHIIDHRFTRSFNVMTVCDYCDKPMFMNIIKCRDCKLRCHRECGSKIPFTCGLPRKFFVKFKGRKDRSSSSNVNLLSLLSHEKRRLSRTQSSMDILCQDDFNLQTFKYNRSTPSSPALLPTTVSHNKFLKRFHFPDILTKKETFSEELHEMRPESTILNERRKSDTDDKHEGKILINISGNSRSDTEGILKRIASLRSLRSQESLSSQGSLNNVVKYTYKSRRSHMEECKILYDEIKIKDMIGRGRFTTVYRGFWHGDVTVKVLNMHCHLLDDTMLNAFKQDIIKNRQSWHENLILFLGICTKPPLLGLVTGLSRGVTLYTCLHLRKDRFTLSEINSIAQQICQGMKYLHSRRIAHKDLRSKNVFIENDKVLLSDFGLFNIIKLCHGNRTGDAMIVPPGWLCYLAPEIIRRLRPLNIDQDKLPYTIDSDIYAFGTILYELLCCEWPFRGQPAEVIIWQVGKGMKQSLANLQVSCDMKDILMYCWSYHPRKRLDFTEIIPLLKKLPHNKLARNFSNPSNRFRPAESVF